MNIKFEATLFAAIMVGVGAQAETNNKFTVSGYASLDVASGYILYGARSNDESCLWSYGELTLGYGKFGAVGVSLWQNTDLTSRRSNVMGRMNEWDWKALYRGGVDLFDCWRLEFEAGHIWYKYHNIRSPYRSDYATMEEWAGYLALANPYVTPYFEYYYDHQVTRGSFLQGGLKKKFEFANGFAITPDLTLGGGDKNYLACLYPPYDGSANGGLSYVQLACTFAYWFNAHFGVHAKVAYVVLTNKEIRASVSTDGGPYENDYVWGSVGVDFAF